MKTSLKTKITIFLKGKYPHFVHSGDLERFGMAEGQKGETTGRRARELAAKRVLEKREVNGSVEYRWLPTQEFISARSPEKVLELRKLTTKLL